MSRWSRKKKVGVGIAGALFVILLLGAILGEDPEVDVSSSPSRLEEIQASTPTPVPTPMPTLATRSTPTPVPATPEYQETPTPDPSPRYSGEVVIGCHSAVKVRYESSRALDGVFDDGPAYVGVDYETMEQLGQNMVSTGDKRLTLLAGYVGEEMLRFGEKARASAVVVNGANIDDIRFSLESAALQVDVMLQVYLKECDLILGPDWQG